MSDSDPLDDGLQEEFGKGSDKRPSESVLAALQAKIGSDLTVHLDADEPSDVPFKVTKEAKALRDPSGRYQTLGEIGRGGVGVVYKGRDQDLGRDVAMKVLKDEYAEHPDVLARFVEEAQIGGQLQHPGIVPVYELGLHAGERPYFAMKLVKGETLSAQLTRRKNTAEDRRRFYGIFEQVCQTMAYAHSRHVVHRDLKPANVMIGAFGEVQVVDWGLAKVLPKGGVADERASLEKARESAASVIETVRSQPGSGTKSVVGSMLGTPAYMPPEQALGDTDKLDQRSDVFGLGAILCEILTGDPPYREQDGNVIRQAANGALDGAHERVRNSGADQAIVELCIEWLSRNRQARPASAQELADRVSQHLTSVEERARQAELRATEARYRQRQIGLVSVAAVLLLAAGGGSWWWTTENARAQLQAAADRVAIAMGSLREAHARAEAASAVRGTWEAASQEAERLERMAGTENIAVEQRHRVEALLVIVRSARDKALADIAQQERDDRMRELLVDARIPTDHNVFQEGRKLEGTRLHRAYSEAFEAYLGQPIERLSPEAAVTALRKGAIQNELVAAIDRWLMVDLSRSLASHLHGIATRLDDDPWRNDLRRLLAKAKDDEHDLEDVRNLVSRMDLEQLSPAHCEVVARALNYTGANRQAVQVIRRARERYPQDFALAFWHAVYTETSQTDGRKTDPAATYRAFEIVRAIRPDHLEVSHRQGMALKALGRHRDALRLFESLCERDPDNGHWHTHVGLQHESLNQPDQAAASYRAALERSGSEVLALANLGRIHANQGSHKQAIELLQRSLASPAWQPKERAAMLHLLSSALYGAGRIEKAVERLQQAVTIEPTNSRLHLLLGRLQGEMNRLALAVQSLRKGIELDPSFRSIGHGAIAVFLWRICLWEAAAAELKLELEVNPRSATAHLNLGVWANIRGELSEAAEHYRQAIAYDPNNGLAHGNLANVQCEQGNIKEAIWSYEQSLRVTDGKQRSSISKNRHGLSVARLLADARERLRAIASGTADGASSAEWSAAARLLALEQVHAGATRVWLRAFTVAPDLAAQTSYLRRAAIQAAMAAERATDADTQTRMRAHAFTWLTAALELCRPGDESEPGYVPARYTRYNRLKRLQVHKGLLSLRDEASRAALPAAENERWRELWRQVDLAVVDCAERSNPDGVPLVDSGSVLALDDATLRARIAKLPPKDSAARVELVFELLAPGRAEAGRFPAIALELAEQAVELTRSVEAGPLQALAEALFANGKSEQAKSKMMRAMRARGDTGERGYTWMQQRIEAYGK